MSKNDFKDSQKYKHPARAALRFGSVVTVSYALLMLVAGVANIAGPEKMVNQIQALGYPDYVRYFIGVSKVLAAMVLLLSRNSPLREWAYAGFTIEMLLASYSHLMSHDPAGKVLFPLAFGLPLAMSYVLKQQPTAGRRSRCASNQWHAPQQGLNA